MQEPRNIGDQIRICLGSITQVKMSTFQEIGYAINQAGVQWLFNKCKWFKGWYYDVIEVEIVGTLILAYVVTSQFGNGKLLESKVCCRVRSSLWILLKQYMTFHITIARVVARTDRIWYCTYVTLLQFYISPKTDTYHMEFSTPVHLCLRATSITYWWCPYWILLYDPSPFTLASLSVALFFFPLQNRPNPCLSDPPIKLLDILFKCFKITSLNVSRGRCFLVA